MPSLPTHNYNDDPTPSHATSFPLFPHLPQELATRILLFASRSTHSSLTPDVSTTLSLTLVSKPIHALVNPLLYKVVRVTRPSSLVELVDTFEECPELGKLVKHLHVGAEDTLVPGDWPLAMETEQDGMQLQYPILWLKTSLTERDKKKLLPRWCEPGKKWCLEGSGRVDCRGAAVRGAIEAALQALDVEPYKKRYARTGRRIGLPEWTVRIFLLQACLDLYLIEMQHIEDVKGYAVFEGTNVPAPPQDPPICRLGRCGHYPRLTLLQSEETAPETGSKDETTFTLTILQLWKHLTRRGASLDQFNHPIKFAAGVDAGHFNEHGRHLIMFDLDGPHLGYFEPEDYDPEDDAESTDSEAEEDANAKAEAPSFLPYDGGLESQEKGKTTDQRKVTTYTSVGSMVMTSHLLLLTPNVINLSLNGHLHLAFMMMDLDVMENVKSLSLGPLLPYWDGGVFSTGQIGPLLRNLENLRVAGRMLIKDEAWRIAGLGRGLGKLKRFQWELVSATHPNIKPQLLVDSVYKCIRVLQGHEDSDNLDDDPEDLTCSVFCADPSRLIELALHPEDRSAILDHAPPYIRTAWQTGLRVEDGTAPHRVRLVESEAAKMNPSAHRSVAIERLHESARRWWEECGIVEEGKSAGKEEDRDWMPNAGKRLEKEESGEGTASLKKARQGQQRSDSTLFWFQ